MEHNCPGLLYMFTSRPTTIGSPENRFESALFFCSNDMNRDRISDLTKTQKGEECIKIKHRVENGISYLRKNLHNVSVSPRERIELIQWVENTRVHAEDVLEIIEDMSWRKSNQLNY
jgi:hypothetical protein